MLDHLFSTLVPQSISPLTHLISSTSSQSPLVLLRELEGPLSVPRVLAKFVFVSPKDWKLRSTLLYSYQKPLSVLSPYSYSAQAPRNSSPTSMGTDVGSPTNRVPQSPLAKSPRSENAFTPFPWIHHSSSTPSSPLGSLTSKLGIADSVTSTISQLLTCPITGWSKVCMSISPSRLQSANLVFLGNRLRHQSPRNEKEHGRREL